MGHSSTDDDPAECSEPPESPKGAESGCARPRENVANRCAALGVQFDSLATSFVDSRASVEPGASLGAGVEIRGDSKIAAGVRIDAYTIIDSSEIGAGCSVGSFCTIRGGSEIDDGAVVHDRSDVVSSWVFGKCEIGPSALVEDSTVLDGAKVGPFSRVRARSTISEQVYVGTHAEIKSSTISWGSKIGHFSFVGDALLGRSVNIGAGAVTANYDGESVQRTVIWEDVSIGAGTVLVAPINVRSSARTGAGAVVTKDVAAGELVLGVPARVAARARVDRGDGVAEETTDSGSDSKPAPDDGAA